jgi:hypothetical protein
VRIVAIRTKHQAFIDPMVLRLGKIRRDTLMAAIAQPGLSRDKQMRCFRGVDGVTSRTSDSIGQMRRSHEILVRLVLLVAHQTPFARLLRAEACKPDNLSRILSIGMRFAGPVTSLTSLPLRAFLFPCLRSPVGPATVTFRLGLMTRLTGIRADIERRVGWLVRRIGILIVVATEPR